MKKTNDADNNLIRRLSLYANVVYQSEESIYKWNCKNCKIKNFNFVKPHAVNIHEVKNTNFSERMVITLDKQRKEIVVAFRGDVSDGFTRIFMNKEYLEGQREHLNWPGLKPYPINSISLAKFELVYEGLIRLLPNFLQIVPGCKVIFLGHSYGATLAFLAALNVTASNIIPNALVIGLQPARFAGEDFLQEFQKRNIRVISVIDNLDAVAGWPYMEEWTHFGEVKRVYNNVIYDCHEKPLTLFCKQLYDTKKPPALLTKSMQVLMSNPWKILSVLLNLSNNKVSLARKTRRLIYDHNKLFETPFFFFEKDNYYRAIRVLSQEYNEYYEEDSESE